MRRTSLEALALSQDFCVGFVEFVLQGRGVKVNSKPPRLTLSVSHRIRMSSCTSMRVNWNTLSLPQLCLLINQPSIAGGGASSAEVRSAPSAAGPNSAAEGVDLLLAWEAASPLDDAPCRGYSHLYGMRPQVVGRVSSRSGGALDSVTFCDGGEHDQISDGARKSQCLAT